ncbi:MAG: hypothetical protein WCH46_00385 [bacterium]
MALSYKLLFVIIAITTSLPQVCPAQCSDARVCSLHGNENGIFRRSGVCAEYLNGYSGHDYDIRYESLKLGGYYWTSREFNINCVLPLNRQRSGNVAIQGIGDVLIAADYLINDHPGDLTFSGDNSLIQGRFEATSLQLGVKLATGSTNVLHLPLRYQSGLGTNDILLGILYAAANPQKYDYDLFQGGFSLQIPLGKVAQDSFSLQRSIDLLGRIDYNYPILQKFGLKAGALVIAHLTKATRSETFIYTTETSPDPISTEVTSTINENTFQCNITAGATYTYQGDISLETGFILPLLKRKYNYDGLKREYTLFVSANYHFN